ncbi:MAG: helicase-related protein [Spirochaetes bacterium]|nr:helicase-related protein [Spirochaetota bacterium]
MGELRKASDLLIVDNSVGGWTVADYLKQWCEISRRFDIATGNFEIGGLLSLEDAWQKVDELRILMGDSSSLRTKQAFEQALGSIKKVLDDSIEGEKPGNEFLRGVPAIVEGFRQGKIHCRVYRKGRFHAKGYITHARAEVVGAFALVGSSNLSRPGLTENIELNVQLVGPPVHQLQEWYDRHWDEAEDVTPEMLKIIERHVTEYSPFDVYAKALQEYFRGHEITASEWEETKSRLFSVLDRYQKEAYWSLMKIARQHGGAFLCDGVGLGKTFVGLMLIERLVMHEGKRVVLFAPKAAKEGVWIPHLRKYLSHIGGGADFSNLVVFSHTDLNRKNEFPERFRRIAELADVVIIDEAHNFRNTGVMGDDDTDPSRYHKLYALLDPAIRPKALYLITATPINNRLADFRHMSELFSRRDEAYFSRTLGINNLTAHFNALERKLIKDLGVQGSDISDTVETGAILESDSVFRELVVQRSRAYAKASQIREKGASVSFPERKPPQVAAYSIRKSYGKLLDIFEEAFQRQNPLFTLAIYYPFHWYKGTDTDIDPMAEGRQKQVVGLIRTMFLKRFESSVQAFELSCERLLVKLLAFIQKNNETDSEKRRFETWKRQHAEILGFASGLQKELWGEEDQDEEEEDIVSPELLSSIEKLDRAEYEVVEMISETYLDLENLIQFLDEARGFQPKQDDKLQKLIKLLNTKELKERKVLVFTEFADTARYVAKELQNAGIRGVEEVDSASKAGREDVIKHFSPYYNGTTSAELAGAGEKEIRILISTDVLSEGLNLQDASFMINYDIHWNPVRLMQRIGRVDRRMSPDTETALLKDHPELIPTRGTVAFWNFLPPDDLNVLLTLYKTVTHKTLLISKTMGIEGKKLLTPEDDYDALREFNQGYEGEKTALEDMHLEYQDLLAADPGLKVRLDAMPGFLFSGRKRVDGKARGIFFCYALPALDKEKGEFTAEAGTTRWYLFDLDRSAIHEESGEIVASIRCTPETPRHCVMEKATLSEVRAKIEKHIKNSYLKRIDAPVGVKASLTCWMELNEE